LLIAHISDLHFGARLNTQVFKRAIEEINALGPDAIVLTGDVTDEGLLKEFEAAGKGLSKLMCKNMIICSGNHDYRNTGYLLMKRFFQLSQAHDCGELRILVAKTARPDKDEGEVGYRQILWLKKQIESSDRPCVVAMHHHLAPVPDTGLERHTVIDAGDVLAALARASPAAVLCGHKHRPWSWSFEGIQVLNAGSLSDTRLRGFYHNSYNILNIERGRIRASIKIIGGAELSLEEIRKMREEVAYGSKGI